jgi:hypothetical protein
MTLDFDYNKCDRYDPETKGCVTESTWNECSVAKGVLGICLFDLDISKIRSQKERKMINFYRANRWAKTRIIIFNRDHGICKTCGAPNSRNIHHLNDPRFFPKLKYDPDNLITLCDKCHFEWHHPKQKHS